jgi:hypothetical protein
MSGTRSRWPSTPTVPSASSDAVVNSVVQVGGRRGGFPAYPVKHRGVGAQQADTAAAAIARLAGAEVDAPPFSPEIRAKLLTGSKPLYLSAHLAGDERFDSKVVDTPPWPLDQKVIAEEVGPYLERFHER